MAHHPPYTPFRPPYHYGEPCHFYYGQPPSGSASAMPHDAGLPPHSFQHLPSYVDAGILSWQGSQPVETAGAAAPAPGPAPSPSPAPAQAQAPGWYSMPSPYYATPAVSSVRPDFADPGRVCGPPDRGSPRGSQDFTLYPESQDGSVDSLHLGLQTPLRASPPGPAHLSQPSPAAAFLDGVPASVMASPSVEAFLSMVQDWPCSEYIQDRLPHILRLMEAAFPGEEVSYDKAQNLVVLSAWVFGATYDNAIKWADPFLRGLNAAAAGMRLRRLAPGNDQVSALMDIGKRVRREFPDSKTVELPRGIWEAWEGKVDAEEG